MTYVLDASAVLAVLNQEAGAANVAPKLANSVMSVVNAVEVGSKLVDRGMTPEAAWEVVDLLGITMAEFDLPLARTATQLRQQTRGGGLSLADRACLALAIRTNAIAVTADRAWTNVGVGCQVELIR